ncbi:MAG: 1-acyl-sn-glycerol-3-phosphate acyltransferase [Actinomycetota bacterium]|nr:1-acyl-sn-glycerol-3-phosphate acyltransferase [Actinomycetota bacterium]
MATDTFRQGASELAVTLGRGTDDVLAEAGRCLDELATQQRWLAGMVWYRLARYMWSRAYDLDVDHDELEQLRRAARDHPLVFLPSHKSNLDGYVMAAALHANGFPPNHVLGGINLAFWPLGPLGRRVGVIWIRRTFGGDEIYKLALRSYLAHLASQRLNLEWYIEGGRSRTGKLLPARMGLLDYLARGVEETDVDEVLLVPVSIVYDRLNEATEMTAESRGAKKQPETARWMARYAHSQRRRIGQVHVRFGEPLALRGALRDGAGSDRSLALSKVAFEVCTRINRSTPITPIALATLAILGADGWAVTVGQARYLVEPLADYVRQRNLPGGRAVTELDTADGMRRILTGLASSGVVEEYAEGAEPVFQVTPDCELAAGFHRNVIIHWFVNRAIVELSLVAVAEKPDAEDPIADTLSEADRLRDLLKFDFFFAERAAFHDELRLEVDRIAPHWRADHGAVLTTLAESMAASGGVLADRILRSFLEAYWVVADRLAAAGADPVDEEALVTDCLQVGRQYQLQRRIVSGEALSAELFRTGLKLAANRGLLDADNPVLRDGRRALVEQLHDVLRRLELLNRWERTQSRRREGDRVDAEWKPSAPSGTDTGERACR